MTPELLDRVNSLEERVTALEERNEFSDGASLNQLLAQDIGNSEERTPRHH